MKRSVLILSLLAVVAAAALLFWRGGAPAGPGGGAKPPPMVRVVGALTASISETVELTGSVEPYRQAQLASPAEGPIRSLHVREGDHVKAGERLVAIGRTEGVDALMASLREEVRKEEDNLRRTRELVESDALPVEDLDRVRADYERVRAQLIKAEEAAGDYLLSAPWDGVVSQVWVKEGGFVGPRTPLVELYDPASLVVSAAVAERYAPRVREGLEVAVTLDAYPGVPLRGRIARVYPRLDERTRTRTFEVEVAGAVDLLPGMFARLRLPLTTVGDAVIVPDAALMTGSKGQAVVFVVQEGKAQRRPVRTGIEERARVQIVSGLAAGEKVVVTGQERLKDGAAVRVMPEPGASGGSGPGGRPAGPAGAGGPDGPDEPGAKTR